MARDVALLTVEDLIAADFPRTAVDLARRLGAENPEDARAWLALGDALVALGARAANLRTDELTDEEQRTMDALRTSPSFPPQPAQEYGKSFFSRVKDVFS